MTFRQNLWKRVVSLGASALMVIVGGALAVMPLDTDDTLLLRICGYVLIAISLFGFYASLTKSRTVFVVSHEGIYPSYVAAEYRAMIPWSNIERFGEAVAQMRGNKMRYLAFYLRTPQDFQSPMAQAADSALSKLVSDGGTAQLYIPSIMLPESVEKVVARLESLRPKS